MATIKTYSNIEQSKKLAEILPLESADMFYIAAKGEPIFIGNKTVACEDDDYDALGEPDVPCWNLAALLSVLPNPLLNKTYSGWRCDTYNENCTKCQLGDTADNPVDACYETILKLKELNLL